MQPVSVAISDANHGRRSIYEHALRAVPGISLLANSESSVSTAFTSRRSRSRADLTIIENELARVRRLMPRVLLMDINLCQNDRCEMLECLRLECPETFVILVGDESPENEDLIYKALEAGARGYLSHDVVHKHISKVVKVVSLGEVWVSRKIFGKIMDRVQRHELH